MTVHKRLAAAHAVLVVTSYFETLEASDLPVSFDQFGFTDGEKAALALGQRIPHGYAEKIEFLLKERMPIPETHQSFAVVCKQLEHFYARISSRMMRVHIRSHHMGFSGRPTADTPRNNGNGVPARAICGTRCVPIPRAG